MAGMPRFSRRRGGDSAPERTVEPGTLSSLSDPAPTEDQPARLEHLSDEPPVNAPTTRTPWPARLREHARSHVAVVTAALVLIVAAAATLFAPVQGNSCPTTLRALTATSVAVGGGVAPQQAKGEVTADSRAVTSATGQVSDAQAAVDAAQAAQTAAGQLQEKADAAQSAADEAGIAQDPVASNSAQWDVDDAEMALQWAQDDLDRSEEMLAMDKEQGWDTAYDEQAVAEAKAAVKDAEADLAKANAALSAEQSAADSAASDAKSRQATADTLAGMAQRAQDKADAALAAAESALTNAQATLSSAEDSQSAHRQAATAKAALWSHQHQNELFMTRATNTTVADCRAAATKNAAVGAGLLVAAVLLLLVDAFPAMRRKTADTNAHSGPSLTPTSS